MAGAEDSPERLLKFRRCRDLRAGRRGVEQIPERKGTLDKIFDRIPELIDLAQRSADKKCG